MLKKKLIFHFYIPDDYETNVAIKFHYECLRRYCNVFDSAIFYISVNQENVRYIPDVKNTLFNLKEWDDIRIRVVENDIFCEGRTFKEEITDKLGEFNEELVFFGHTKGITNVNQYQNNVENILKWIFCCYFYSLEDVDEVINSLMYDFRIFYGSMLMKSPDLDGAYYNGTFYWVNPMKVRSWQIEGKELAPMMSRAYAENFPMVFPFREGNGYLMSVYNRFFYYRSFYETDFDLLIDFLGEKDEYYKKYNDIIEKIK